MFERNLKVTRQNIETVVGKTFTTGVKVKRKRPGNVFTRGFQYVKNIF